MTNAHFTDISQYQDVESTNYYRIMRDNGVSEADALAILGAKSRDNARTPMQWTAGHEAGFTSGESWLTVNPNHTEINAESEESDPDSILSYYRQLVQLRKDYPIIADGDVRFLETGNENVIAYERTFGGESLTVICNFSGNDEKISGIDVKGRVLIGNWSGSHKIMKPYEVLAILN